VIPIIGLVLILVAAAVYLRFVFAGYHVCGGAWVALMLVGALIVVVSWYASHDARANLARRVAAILFPLTALLDLMLYPASWSVGRFVFFVLVGVVLFFLPYQAVSSDKLATVGVSTALTFLLVSVPLEIVLRNEYSQYHLLGVYGHMPTRLEPTLNSSGYRDVEHGLDKPAGVVRILILGDSLTFGEAVVDNEVYPGLLTQMAGSRVEVISLARQGWGTADQLGALRREGLAYDPDIVVVGVVTNDPEPLEGQYSGRQPEWQFFTCSRLDLDSLRFLDYQLNRLGDQLGLRHSYLAWELDLYDPDKPYWPAWQRTVRQLGDELASADVLALAFTLPSPVPPQSEEYARKYELLTQGFADAGFEAVDLWPRYVEAFAAVPYRELWALPNNGHPGPELHAFYAREMWAVLQPHVKNLNPE
jgi:hypothetical protein